MSEDWRGGLFVLIESVCSVPAPTQGYSRPHMTLVSGDLMLCSGFCSHGMWHTCIHTGTHTNTKKQILCCIWWKNPSIPVIFCLPCPIIKICLQGNDQNVGKNRAHTSKEIKNSLFWSQVWVEMVQEHKFRIPWTLYSMWQQFHEVTQQSKS